MEVEAKDLSEFVRFILAVSRRTEIPKTKLLEELFLGIPDEEKETLERAALENGLIDADMLFYQKALLVDWLFMPEDELIQRVDEYLRYRKHQEQSPLESALGQLERHNFRFIEEIIKKKEIKEQSDLCHLLDSLVRIKEGNRANALSLSKFLVESGAQLKTFRRGRFATVSIDVKATARRLPPTDPVAQFITSLPDPKE
jgi:hypothetical protein